MAEEKAKPAQAKTVPKETQEPKAESVYSIKELVDNSRRLFGCSKFLALTAIKLTGAKELTVSAAARAIKEFSERKV